MGTIHHAAKELSKTIAKIQADPNARWVGMGDKIEAIAPKDKRFDMGVLCDWVDPDNLGVDQSRRYVEVMKPIRDKCLGLLCGNHEDAMKSQNHIDCHKNICADLGVDNLGDCCFLKLVFGRGKEETHIYTSVFTHGAGSPIMPGTKLQRLSRLMDMFDADIIAQGHLHDLVTYSKPYLTLNNNNQIKERVRVGAVTGCYFTTYTQDRPSSYGEKKNYPPTMLGSPVFVIHPDKGILRVENG